MFITNILQIYYKYITNLLLNVVHIAAMVLQKLYLLELSIGGKAPVVLKTKLVDCSLEAISWYHKSQKHAKGVAILNSFFICPLFILVKQ